MSRCTGRHIRDRHLGDNHTHRISKLWPVLICKSIRISLRKVNNHRPVPIDTAGSCIRIMRAKYAIRSVNLICIINTIQITLCRSRKNAEKLSLCAHHLKPACLGRIISFIIKNNKNTVRNRRKQCKCCLFL